MVLLRKEVDARGWSLKDGFYKVLADRIYLPEFGVERRESVWFFKYVVSAYFFVCVCVYINCAYG